MDKDATWYGARPRPRRLCVRWGPNSPQTKRAQPPIQFSAHVYCGQTAEWMKIPLGTEVDLDPGHIVLDGDPAPPPLLLWSRASVCLSAAACPHCCTDPDVTWRGGRGCPLIVHYWADLQSVHGLRCYGNTMEMRGRAQR